MATVAEAALFLRWALARGPLPAERVVRAAAVAGFSERTLARAKAATGTRSQKTGFGAGTGWLWALPGQDRGEDCQGPNGVLRGVDSLVDTLRAGQRDMMTSAPSPPVRYDLPRYRAQENASVGRRDVLEHARRLDFPGLHTLGIEPGESAWLRYLALAEIAAVLQADAALRRRRT